ncbi:hypothetical protein GCM10027610_073950 [Dactylosporangium cerinum]
MGTRHNGPEAIARPWRPLLGPGSLCLAAFGAGAAALKGSPAVAALLGMTPPDDFAMTLGGCRSC